MRCGAGVWGRGGWRAGGLARARARAPSHPPAHHLAALTLPPHTATQPLLPPRFPKQKAAKQAVHIPCWDSFKWNPLRWRGACFGR